MVLLSEKTSNIAMRAVGVNESLLFPEVPDSFPVFYGDQGVTTQLERDDGSILLVPLSHSALVVS